LDGDAWVKLERLFIDSHFDAKKIKNVSKVKIKGSHGFEGTFQVKITISDKDYYYSMTQELQLQWFTYVINTRIEEAGKGVPQVSPFANACAGKVFKKSFLG
jgi:hypothetical protein